MIFLRVLAAGASFLLFLLLCAFGGFAFWLYLPPTWPGGDLLVPGRGITSHGWFWAGAGAVVGALLGALVAFQVWSHLGRRSREGPD